MSTLTFEHVGVDVPPNVAASRDSRDSMRKMVIRGVDTGAQRLPSSTFLSVDVAEEPSQAEPTDHSLSRTPDRTGTAAYLNPPASLVERPANSVPEASQVTLQRWQGRVASIAETEFIAIVRDLTDPSRPLEQVTFGLDQVDEDDRVLLDADAVFYWFIHKETRRGTVKTTSELRFRRLARWTRTELSLAKHQANELASWLRVDDNPAGTH